MEAGEATGEGGGVSESRWAQAEHELEQARERIKELEDASVAFVNAALFSHGDPVETANKLLGLLIVEKEKYASLIPPGRVGE